MNTLQEPIVTVPGLLPIGTRVTHFDGGEGTHGQGRIIGYNGIKPNAYLKENFKDAVNMAAAAGLLDAVVSSVYDGARCPYLVRWDYRQAFFDRHPHLKERFPKGYEDVYEPDSINELKE